MIYINMKYNGKVETIDEFETRKESMLMLREYKIAYRGIEVFLSKKSTKDFKDN